MNKNKVYLSLVAFIMCTISACSTAFAGDMILCAGMFLLALINLFILMDYLDGGGRPA